MKKLIAMTMVAVMSVGLLAGCGSSTASTSTDSSASDSSAATESASDDSASDFDRSGEFVTVATGPTSGLYYPIGGAYATALSDYGYTTSAEATNASGANVQLILDGDAEMAIVMQDVAVQAYTAEGAYEGAEPAEGMSAIMRLWPNYVQLVTTADTGITCVEDLVGKRVGVGASNSGVEINARMVLDAYGITYDDITADYLAYGEAIENMKNGQCDAVFVTSGIPNATVMELDVSYDMVVVPIDGAGRDKLVSDYPYYAETIIPAGTYSNEEDVEGVFVYNIMVVPNTLSEDMVYDMMLAIEDGMDTIQASHSAAEADVSMDTGIADLQLPLHPGAAKYWSEKGFE